MSIGLETNIQYLGGVGEKRASLYAKLGIATVRDLLYHFPRDYIDLSQPYTIASAPLMEPMAVRATLTYKSREQRIRGGLSIFKLLFTDGTNDLDVTVFNAKYTVDGLALDSEYILYGRMEGSLLRRQMASPQFFAADQEHSILPIYPLTAGIYLGLVRRNIRQILEELDELPETIGEDIRVRFNLGERNASLRNIHFPASLEAAGVARDRFVFEELLVLALALSSLHAENQAQTVEPMQPVDLSPFWESLPFAPTAAQLRSVAEALADMEGTAPMNRLVQGDVGSGKTLVAAACIYFVHQNGGQSAIMAPTEILAEQHLDTLRNFLEPHGIHCALLTGSTRAAEKRKVLAGLADGSVHLCIGTHALLSEGVDFAKLDLVVTDEQHRFGVAQRTKLSQKSENCHVLVMSATPIPRTLSLIIYGDLSLSLVDELPPGRRPVETLVIGSGKLARAMGFVRKNLDEGRQAYIVCPLIEMGEIDNGLKPAVEYAAHLAENDLKDYRVGLLHGKMKPKEKDATMRSFKAGEIQALVSTTVVEVGVDVPNASIILIENAERFGLSQLHQLRGRVGRGEHQSYCILVSDAKGELARRRLTAMKEIGDGFKLAEYDLQLRGPGDFFGQRQHGLPELHVASLSDNLDTLKRAQECAGEILQEDPLLQSDSYQQLRQSVDRMLHSVGDRPN
ncbi:MAG: ATP-dependent DNA helicase RecG [Oscillospiraceae bacterium]